MRERVHKESWRRWPTRAELAVGSTLHQGRLVVLYFCELTVLAQLLRDTMIRVLIIA